MGPGAAGAVPELIRSLKDAKEKNNAAAAQVLAAMGDPAVPALTEALTGSDPDLRNAAESVLRRIDTPDSRRVLEKQPDKWNNDR
jgi:HEAT repeat protein